MTIDTDRFRRMLTEERARLQEALEHIHQSNVLSLEEAGGEETSFDNHPADSATITFDREMDYTLEGNAEAVLAAIDDALRRIEDGTYGTCQRCGKEIPAERLEAAPYVELCIDCKREAERG
jgi:RNA polymerase-binding protein DksA